MQEKEIFSRILERYDTHMTGAEQRIADYLLKNPHESITFSVATLARKAGTSEATVVRFAKTLGFGGFLAFKQELLRRASKDLAAPERYERIEQGGRAGNPVARIADSEVANIAETVDQLDLAAFDGAAQMLRKAGLVYTVGSGLSSHLARIASYQLTIVGKRSFALPESSAAYDDQLRLADSKSDVLLAFSFPPYSKSVLAAAEYAVERRVPVVCVSDRRQSPVARLATHVLLAANDNQLPINSITATSVLLTALLGSLGKGRRTEG